MARPKAKAAPRFVEPEDESQDPEDRQRLEAEEPETSGRRMSKTDAIRAAMAEGIESPGDGVDFIRKRFGLEMSKQHFSATKSKLKSAEGATLEQCGSHAATGNPYWSILPQNCDQRSVV
jgi:hypothetical protein